jgi:hypothetical protein
MSKGFSERNTDRSIVDGVKKLTGLQKILRKYPDDPTGRKKMLKQWKKYHYGWMGEMDRLEQSADSLENIPVALEELKEVMPDMPTEPVEINQVPTEQQIQTIRNAIGKD